MVHIKANNLRILGKFLNDNCKYKRAFSVSSVNNAKSGYKLVV
jgi:hypothetical protein